MIFIKSGHILTLCGAATPSELQEFESLVARGYLRVLSGCIGAFRAEESDQLRVGWVARSYDYRRHEMLSCAGGFVGHCRWSVDESMTTQVSEVGVVRAFLLTRADLV